MKQSWKIKTPIIYFLVAFACVIAAMPLAAHQPTPPVTIEFESAKGSSEILEVVMIITPNVDVSDAKLLIDTDRRVQFDLEDKASELDLSKPQQLVVRFRTKAEEPVRIDFRVEADAKLYSRAGGFARRYIRRDARGNLELVTGAVLRDTRKREITGEQGNNGKEGSPLDDLTGAVEKVDLAKIKFEQLPRQLIAPPAGGIEEIERDSVRDMTQDQIRELDPITVRGQVFFTDRSGAVVPMVNATVDIRDDDTFGDEHLVSVITGWDGTFEAVVNSDDGWLQNGRDIYARVRTSNSRFRVQDCGVFSSTFAWRTTTVDEQPDGAVVDFGGFQPGSDMDAAIIFQDLNNAWNHVTSSGRQDPGFVNLCWPESGSFYDFSNVNIEDGDEGSRDIVVHEYAHAIMHNAYDNNFWPPNATGPHTLCDSTPQSETLAFTEGWATFIALSVNPDGVYDSTSFSWAQENNSCTNANGKRDESMVTAGLLDLEDTNSDGNCAANNCDPSGANTVALVDQWRDTVFAVNIETMDQYWDVLCPELNGNQHDFAIDSLSFNNISVAACQCTAEISLASTRASSARISDDLSALREFRDLALKKTSVGQRMIEHYYAHHREATKLLMSGGTSLRDAASLFTRVAGVMRNYKLGRGTDEALLDKDTAVIAKNLASVLKESGSPGLRSAVFEAEQFIDRATEVPISRLEPLLSRMGSK